MVWQEIISKKFQKDLNNKSPHEALDFIQNSSLKSQNVLYQYWLSVLSIRKKLYWSSIGIGCYENSIYW